MYKQEDIEKVEPYDSAKAYHEEPPKRNNSKIYFFIIAIAALLATNIYFYVKFKSSGEKLYTMAIQKQDLQTEIDRIEAELDNLIALRAADTDASLEASEQRAREAISVLRSKLETQTITEEDILIAKREVAKLKDDVSGLRTALNELKMRNELLQRENANLSDQVSSTGKQVDVLSQENSRLKDKVVAASALKVSNMQVNGVSVSKKGKIETESRARRVEQLQILFSIADNTLAKVGDKEVFVRIIDPVGNLFGDANNIFYVHGEKLQYTFKDVINFSNNGEEYQFLWPLDKFRKGAYTVLLYNDNAIMGRGGVVLK
ncbi:MbeD/MobD like protein [Sphingobacterium allocomposti]|uniref:MbeD/MobD like protein n=1 Tax=Sphingobacterium allocomposti TaxID=415956 RepID=A0A5S5D7S6_9SPHI|nr:MbeD/MobD family mobilization/exclusion protein [Sphingobacterium composti Yoo et al. 2007 non Ten et al. 2007]TYP91534.1 MbeD/MobD like protein [Sphingobacterium composti Yoo et al. 2007 non Ten et al. 2007]